MIVVLFAPILLNGLLMDLVVTGMFVLPVLLGFDLSAMIADVVSARRNAISSLSPRLVRSNCCCCCCCYDSHSELLNCYCFHHVMGSD